MPFRSRLLAPAFLVSCGLSFSAQAHPHVWVSVQSELVMDGQKIKAINHTWTFDEAFSAFASQGLDEDDDGVLTREELQPLAQVNVESLSEYGYFSDLSEKGAPDTGKSAFGEPHDYWLSVSGDQLVLHFTLPVVADIDTHKEAVLDVYDPSFFVDFAFADKNPAKLVNAPSNCHARIERPKGLDDDVASQLAAIPADQRDIPSDLMQFTVAMANQVFFEMRLRVGPLRPFAEAPVAGTVLVVLGLFVLWLLLPQVAHAAPSPFGVALPDTTGPMATSGLWADIQRWILARQSEFYMALKDAVKLVRTSWPALFLLLGLSMAYGLFHAAGPGHGKVVLTTYLFASGASARKGALLALVAAMVQASVAVLLIGVAAVVLNLTSIVITQTAQLLELASYAMFVILGAWLILRAIRSIRYEWGRLKDSEPIREGAGHAHHHVHGHEHSHDHEHEHEHHHHDEACGCGHSHAASLELVEQAKGVRGMALAVISMGLRPCSGALIVLVFALSQKVFWAGVLSAYAMGLGTGLTVAALALVAVYARSFSQALANRGLSNKALSWFGVIILFCAGVIVLMFGGILLLANLL